MFNAYWLFYLYTYEICSTLQLDVWIVTFCNLSMNSKTSSITLKSTLFYLYESMFKVRSKLVCVISFGTNTWKRSANSEFCVFCIIFSLQSLYTYYKDKLTIYFFSSWVSLWLSLGLNRVLDYTLLGLLLPFTVYFLSCVRIEFKLMRL